MARLLSSIRTHSWDLRNLRSPGISLMEEVHREGGDSLTNPILDKTVSRDYLPCKHWVYLCTVMR
ncbi:hypothetical protein XFEB_00041 [Xylella fastidiosa EB92.1]|nr:hypothetical protein XFEB_00041 [Xylella fastidiosa EB92.1]